MIIFSHYSHNIAPSALPMPARCDMNSYTKQIRHAENCIRERSKRAEGKWCTDKFQTSTAGKTIYFLL